LLNQVETIAMITAFALIVSVYFNCWAGYKNTKPKTNMYFYIKFFGLFLFYKKVLEFFSPGYISCHVKKQFESLLYGHYNAKKLIIICFAPTDLFAKNKDQT